MINLYPDGHYVIAQDVFGKNSKTMLNVINHGQMVDEIISFINREGQQHKHVFDVINESINVFPVEEINIEKSLYYWYRNNGNPYHKNLVYKKDLTSGEKYKMFGWSFSLMLLSDDDNIYYNINFE